ncbi:WD domain G-beta repeat [Phytophthora infestans]|uniref:WD domain G-beta repeat n=1 Tax=Phytophthora infestans TaxID=4787 RepID=A0A833SK31_PHYIN|nr:WD domain G-beta repeat [Phytophthora infestans]
MANLAQQLSRLQLGPSGARHRPSKRLNDPPPTSINISSITLQRSSIQRSLFASLHCPRQRVLALRDGPEAHINGQATGSLLSLPIFQVAYAHSKNLLAAVDEEGAVGVFNMAAGRRKGRWMAHHNAVFDVIWTQDDTQVLTAAGDLEIRIWDVQTAGSSSSTPVSTLKGHEMSVKCVRQGPDKAHMFASGGRDGRLLLWDTRAPGKPVSCLENVHAEPTSSRTSSSNVNFTSPIQKRRRRTAAASSTSPSPRSVTCVEFTSTGNEVITAGAVDAVVKYWDLRRLSNERNKTGAKLPIAIREISCSSREGARRGISSLTLHQRRAGGASRLLVNVVNDSIVVLDTQQARTILRCSGHQASSFYCKTAFSPEGNFIAGASADGVVYLWDARVDASYDATIPSFYSGLSTQQRAPCYALKGHTNEVNGVAWSSQDSTQLASCSDDGTVRCWQVGGGHENSVESPRFELQIAPGDSFSDRRMGWANWNEFTDQPDGYAYRVRGYKATEPSHSLSPRRQRVEIRYMQRASPQVTKHSSEPRLHPVHEAPIAQQQPLQEPQTSQETRPQSKLRVKLRRKVKPHVQPKRGQRTLLELWGR